MSPHARRHCGTYILASMVIAFILLPAVISARSASALSGVVILTSSDSHGREFFGEGLLQVVVTNPDADDDDLQESITVEVGATPDVGPFASSAFEIRETGVATGQFEFYLAHADADNVSVAAIDAINENGAAEFTGTNIEAPVIRFGAGEELPVTSGLFEDVSFDITVADVEIVVDYEESLALLALDRSTYGSQSLVYMLISDQDANEDPTNADTFIVTEANLNAILFDIDGAIFVDDVTFEETGDNTAQFEGILQLTTADTATDPELEITAESVQVTLNDKAAYYNAAITDTSINTSTDTDDVSFDVDDVDGDIGGIGTVTFGSELVLMVNDLDQNKDSNDDETLDEAVAVSLDAPGGDIEQLNMVETDDNSAVFIIALANNELAITFLADGDTPIANNGVFELRQSDIAQDILVEYFDQLNDDSVPEAFSTLIEMTVANGLVDLPETVGLEDTFTLPITDADLNDKSQEIDSYEVTLGGTGPFFLHRNGDPIGSLASIEIIIAGIEPDFQVPLDYALVENGANTGVFESELNVQDLLASAGLSSSVGTGDVIIVNYTDATAFPSPIVSQDETTINFFVVPESPIGSIAMLMSAVAALGTFLWMKKLRSRA